MVNTDDTLTDMPAGKEEAKTSRPLAIMKEKDGMYLICIYTVSIPFLRNRTLTISLPSFSLSLSLTVSLYLPILYTLSSFSPHTLTILSIPSHYLLCTQVLYFIKLQWEEKF